MTGTPIVHVKRIYDPPEPSDGTRVLVDRLWPRGVSKERAQLADWCKDVAPSTELRQWYGHDPAKFDEFAARYRDELSQGVQAASFAKLKSLASEGTLILLTASKRADISEAKVLAELIHEAPHAPTRQSAEDRNRSYARGCARSV